MYAANPCQVFTALFTKSLKEGIAPVGNFYVRSYSQKQFIIQLIWQQTNRNDFFCDEMLW